MPLFNSGEPGDFVLHSGASSDFLIDCEELTDKDLESLAAFACKRIGPYGRVIGVPRGGLRFAAAMEPYCNSESDVTLLVDDVLTSGYSMVEAAVGLNTPYTGLVIFSRSLMPPAWIKCIFCLGLSNLTLGAIGDSGIPVRPHAGDT